MQSETSGLRGALTGGSDESRGAGGPATDERLAACAGPGSSASASGSKRRADGSPAASGGSSGHVVLDVTEQHAAAAVVPPKRRREVPVSPLERAEFDAALALKAGGAPLADTEVVLSHSASRGVVGNIVA